MRIFSLVGDGLDHEIRPVADVSGRAKKDRADADGEQDSARFRLNNSSMSFAPLMPKSALRKLRYVGALSSTLDRMPVPQIKNSRRRVGAQQRARVQIQPVERGNHRGKNAGEQNGHLLNRMEIEMVRLVHGFGGREIRTRRGGQHDAFAQKNRLVDEHRAQNDRQKKQIRQPVKFPGFMRRLPFAHRPRRADEVDPVHDVKNRQQDADARSPTSASNAPPPTRTEPPANNRETSGGSPMGVRQPPTFATMKMKKTMWCAVTRYWFIRIHGRISSIAAPVVPRRLASDGADEQKKHVGQRRRLAFDVDVDAAGNDE